MLLLFQALSRYLYEYRLPKCNLKAFETVCFFDNLEESLYRLAINKHFITRFFIFHKQGTVIYIGDMQGGCLDFDIKVWYNLTNEQELDEVDGDGQ